MRIVATPIPDNSHGIRVWNSLPEGDSLPRNKDDYQFTCIFVRINSESCELAQAQGKLTKRTLFALGEKARELGYKTMLFCRPKGKEPTRWATYLYTKDNLDYYEVNLNGPRCT